MSQRGWLHWVDTLRLELVAPRLAFGIATDAANTLSVRSVVSILRRKLVPSFAVRHRPVFGPSLFTLLLSPTVNLLFGRDDLLKRPALFDSATDRIGREPVLRSQINGYMLNTVDDDFDGPPRVLGLLGAGGPLAVFGAVWSVIINAVQGRPLWPVAHIGNEPPEVSPLLADGNAARAISVIVVGLRRLASPAHLAPSDVQGVILFSHGACLGNNTTIVKGLSDA